MTEPARDQNHGTRTAFITGITGQDGSYLSEHLVSSGWIVHGMVRAGDHAHHDSPAVVTLHTGDLTDASRMSQLIAEVQPDAVFNLGGMSSVAKSWQQPYEAAIVTGAASVALLEAAWQLQERTGRQIRYLQASSAEIFGKAAAVPQDESTPIRPITPYGAAKAFAHHAVETYRSRGLFASSAILYNHESLRRPATFVTRRITLGVAAVALGLKKRLSLGNLDAVRDFGWAPDYVDALDRIATADRADDFIVATGKSHSVKQFAASAFAAAGVPDGLSLIDTDPRFHRPAEALEMRGNPSKISATLGWTATTDFESIVQMMVDHDIKLVREHGLAVLPQD